jgi:hypothetical protein
MNAQAEARCMHSRMPPLGRGEPDTRLRTVRPRAFGVWSKRLDRTRWLPPAASSNRACTGSGLDAWLPAWRRPSRRGAGWARLRRQRWQGSRLCPCRCRPWGLVQVRATGQVNLGLSRTPGAAWPAPCADARTATTPAHRSSAGANRSSTLRSEDGLQEPLGQFSREAALPSARDSEGVMEHVLDLRIDGVAVDSAARGTRSPGLRSFAPRAQRVAVKAAADPVWLAVPAAQEAPSAR